VPPLKTLNSKVVLTPFPRIVQPYVTELDLRHSLIPDDLIADLVHSMPPHKGPDLQQDRNLPKFDYISFMEKITQDGRPVNGDAEGSRLNGT